MITNNVSTLKIHKLTQAQYDRELAAGRIDENALYLTPDVNSESVDMSKYFETVGTNTLTWDGDISGKAVLDGSLMDSSISEGVMVVAKISDEAPTPEQLNMGAVMKFANQVTGVESDEISIENFFEYSEGTGIYFANNDTFQAPPIVVIMNDIDLGGVIAEKGTYLLKLDLGGHGVANISSASFNGYEFNKREIIKEKYLPELSWNDLEDRPFYSEGFQAVKLLSETIEGAIVDEEYPDEKQYFITTIIDEMVVGKIYAVNYNGNDYECIARDASEVSELQNTILLGNFDMLNGTGDSGEPFAIVIVLGGMEGIGGMMMPLDGSTTINLSISYEEEEVIHKLDNKFLDMAWIPTEKIGWNTLYDGTVTFEDQVSTADINPVFKLEVGKNYRINVVKDNGTIIEFSGSPVYVVHENGYDFVISSDRTSIVVKYSIKLNGEESLYIWRDIVEEVEVDWKVKIEVEDMIPNKIPEKFLPEHSWNNLKDRPFGEEYTEVFPLTDMTYYEDVGMFSSDILLPEDLENGKTYKVTFNGKDYYCPCTVMQVDTGEIAAILGNMDAVNETGNSGEPFVITSVIKPSIDTIQPIRSILMVSLDGSTTASLSISKPITKTLDPKYIEGMYYTESRNSVIIPETEITSDSILLEYYIELEGDYIVTFNSVEYKCTTKQYSNGNVNMPYLGNLNKLIPNSDPAAAEPFIIVSATDQNQTIIAVDTNILPVTISVKECDNIHKIDEKYLPDNRLDIQTREFPSEDPFKIVYGNGVYVGIVLEASDNKAIYSYDGINWEIVEQFKDLVYADHFTDILYTDNKFIIVGYEDKAYHSINGVTWIEGSTGLSTVNVGKRIYYVDNKFIIINQYPTEALSSIATSTDCINWTVTDLDINIRSSVYGNGKFIAISLDDDGYNVKYSTDCINWNTSFSNGNLAITGNLDFCKDRFFLGRLYSTDGINWTEDYGIPKGRKFYVNNTYFACSGNKLKYSTDGINWKDSTVNVADVYSMFKKDSHTVMASVAMKKYQYKNAEYYYYKLIYSINNYDHWYTCDILQDGVNVIDHIELQVSNRNTSESNNITNDKAIIDVLELPETGSKGSFYRLFTASFVQRKEVIEQFTCKCVDGLPYNPEPVTRDMNSVYAYYNTKDGRVRGYVDDTVAAAAGGISTGWYLLDQLAAAFGVEWGGVINDIDDSKDDDYLVRLLLKPKFYLYDNRWMEVPFGYETVPEFDIAWDGVIGDRLTLDAYSITGREGSSIVKISDDVFTVEQLINSKIVTTDGYEEILDESLFDTEMIPGVISIGGSIGIVYSSDDANTALGLPSGYLSNGTYFGHIQKDGEVIFYVKRLTGKTKVTKIDEKFLPEFTSTSSYEHPATHPATMIVEDSTHRFVTDEEKSTWSNSSYTHPSYASKSSGLYKITVDGTGHVSNATTVTKSDITALGIPSQDTVYTHPSSHPATMITQDSTHRFVTDSEKSAWNSKAGKKVNGVTFTIKDADGNDTQVVAKSGAEIFNDSNNKAIGYSSHAEGENTIASGARSHAEGLATTASGDDGSHAEGWKTTASGLKSHAEGSETTASGYASHAEGSKTTALSTNSHAEGTNTEASGSSSHAEGVGTIASGSSQHVQGRYNIEDTENKYAHIVGNGERIATTKRSNAHTLDWNGKAWFASDVYVGGTGQDDTNAKKLITQSDMEAYIEQVLLGGAW